MDGLFIIEPLTGKSIDEGESRVALLRIAHQPSLDWNIVLKHLARKHESIFGGHGRALSEMRRKGVSGVAAYANPPGEPWPRKQHRLDRTIYYVRAAVERCRDFGDVAAVL